MDWIDQSQQQNEAAEAACQLYRRKAGPARRADGLCANDCGEPAITGGAFCCAECRDDWDRRERAGLND